jgi:hypothetical protein
MKKQFASVLLFVTAISYGQSNSKTIEGNGKETDFKNYIESLVELKDGYVFKECSHLYTSSIDTCDKAYAYKMSAREYVYLHANTQKEENYDAISNQNYIIGCLKGSGGSAIIVTANKTSNDSIYKFYNPELRLYNKRGEKLACFNLGRNECLKTSNFIISKRSIISKYACTDTTWSEIDDEGNEITPPKKIINKNERYLLINFDSVGFSVTYGNGKIVRFHQIFSESPLKNYIQTFGEIVFTNGAKYKGSVGFGDNDTGTEDGSIGEFKNNKGEVLKGRFCGDTVLCKFPKLFFGKHFIGEPLLPGAPHTLITKDELLKGDLAIKDGKIISMEIVFKAGKLVKMFEIVGSSFKGNADLIAALNLIESGQKIYLYIKTKDNNGTNTRADTYVIYVK